jgi:hypothetical protein
MAYKIKDEGQLNKILWADFGVGGFSGITGLCFSSFFERLLNLPYMHILLISGITLVYALSAGFLAQQLKKSIPLLRLQIKANWVWAAISLGLLLLYLKTATIFGVIYLVLQILVVGALAYLEGNQLEMIKKTRA